MVSRGTLAPRRFPSDWNVHEMKARKPCVSSWSSRTRRMCSTRSDSVSTWPYIIVAVVDMPSRCAWRITFSHPAVVFLGAMMRRTRSTRISAPPPGSESSPASRRRVSVSGTLSRERRAMCSTSGGDSACRWIG